MVAQTPHNTASAALTFQPDSSSRKASRTQTAGQKMDTQHSPAGERCSKQSKHVPGTCYPVMLCRQPHMYYVDSVSRRKSSISQIIGANTPLTQIASTHENINFKNQNKKQSAALWLRPIAHHRWDNITPRTPQGADFSFVYVKAMLHATLPLPNCKEDNQCVHPDKE